MFYFKDIAVIFVIDGSSSVGYKNFEILKKWLVNITMQLSTNILADVGIVQYSQYRPSEG